jgi:hypothetical protein
MIQLDPSHHPDSRAAYAALDGGQNSPRSTRETETIWYETEGQVVNAGAFLVAVALCWLILPIIWALWRYWRTACHRYTLTNARLLEETGIFVKHLESVELYRVKDISVSGTLMQRIFGCGQVIVISSDVSSPTLVLNAVPDPMGTCQLIRNAVEACRAARGVRSVDY